MVTRVEIDQQHLEVLLGGDGQREIDRGEGLALARLGARYHDDAVFLRVRIGVEFVEELGYDLPLDEAEFLGDARPPGRGQRDAVVPQGGAVDRDLPAVGGERIALGRRRAGLGLARLRRGGWLRRGRLWRSGGCRRLRARRLDRGGSAPIAVRGHGRRGRRGGILAVAAKMRRGAFDEVARCGVHYSPTPPPATAR